MRTIPQGSFAVSTLVHRAAAEEWSAKELEAFPQSDGLASSFTDPARIITVNSAPPIVSRTNWCARS